MSTLTDTIRAHYIASVDSGRFDGDGLDALLADVEALQHSAAVNHPRMFPASGATDFLHAELASRRFGVVVDLDEFPKLEILKGNADLGAIGLQETDHD